MSIEVEPEGIPGWNFVIPEGCTTEEAMRAIFEEQLAAHGVKPGDRVHVWLLPPPPEDGALLKWWTRLLAVEDAAEDNRLKRKLQLDINSRTVSDIKVLEDAMVRANNDTGTLRLELDVMKAATRRIKELEDQVKAITDLLNAAGLNPAYRLRSLP